MSFSEIFKKAIRRNATIGDAMDDKNKELLAGTSDGVFGCLGANFVPQIAASNAHMLGQAPQLRAKWRRRAALTGPRVRFKDLNGCSADMRKMLKNDEKSRSAPTRTLTDTTDDALMIAVQSQLAKGADPGPAIISDGCATGPCLQAAPA